MAFTILPAASDDVAPLLAMIRALADYERLTHLVSATEAALARSLFGERPHAEALIAWDGEKKRDALGFALFFHNFSTFEGKPGLYLEDLFVRPEARGTGLGKALLAHLAALAVARDCARLEWWVLDWNEPSIGFYKKLGAKPMDEWTVFRLEGEALAGAAKS